MFRSSCYQISATTNTWDRAQRDCEQKGAHLVIFEDQEEEVFVFLSPLFNHLTACVPSANHEKHLSPHRVFSIFLTLILKCGSVWALKTPVPARQHGRGWMEPDLPLSKTCQTFVSRSSVIWPHVTVNRADADKIKLFTLHKPPTQFLFCSKWNGDNLNTGKRCAFLQNGRLLNWVEDNCLSFHNWMCERKLSARKARPTERVRPSFSGPNNPIIIQLWQSDYHPFSWSWSSDHVNINI